MPNYLQKEKDKQIVNKRFSRILQKNYKPKWQDKYFIQSYLHAHANIERKYNNNKPKKKINVWFLFKCIFIFAIIFIIFFKVNYV